MPTTIFTPQMLRNGTRSVPEIPVGSSFSNTYSMDFDGTDDYVSTSGVYSELDGLTNTAFSFWMKTSNTAGVRIVLSIGTPSGDFRACQFQIWSQNGAIRIYYNGLSYTAVSNSVIANDVWAHVLVTRDSSRAINDKVRIYINGIDETSSDSTRFLGTSSAADTGLFIGEHPNGYTSPFLGNIDEVAIYNQDMAAYISEIYSVDGAVDLSLLSTPPTNWFRMGDNGSYKSPQWLIPNNENKDKISNYSMEFDGVNDYVSLTSLVPLGLTSISFWMKSTHSSGNDSITTGLGNLGFIGTTPLVLLRSSNYRYFADQASKFDGEWHHWFLLIAGSGQSDITNSRLFVDGVEISSGTTVNSSTPSPWTSTRIGRGAYGYLNCSINNFAVWEGSDESANVSTIYNSGTPNDISSLSPTAWLKMGEDATFSTNWTVPDQVGSNDGTSNAMTIEDRVGSAPSSSNNAVSFNMDEVDRVEDVPS